MQLNSTPVCGTKNHNICDTKNHNICDTKRNTAYVTVKETQHNYVTHSVSQVSTARTRSWPRHVERNAVIFAAFTSSSYSEGQLHHPLLCSSSLPLLLFLC